MTVKYIFVGCYSNNSLRGRFAECHCPMDDQMIKIVYDEYNSLTNRDEKLLITQRKDGRDYFGISHIYWSKIGFEETNDKTSRTIYDNFQKMVFQLCKEMHNNDTVLPIEYDFLKHGKM